jgi:hypothetical protein
VQRDHERGEQRGPDGVLEGRQRCRIHRLTLRVPGPVPYGVREVAGPDERHRDEDRAERREGDDEVGEDELRPRPGWESMSKSLPWARPSPQPGYGDTKTAPVMPLAAWPGMVHWNR